MLIRASLAGIALLALWTVHAKWPWIEVSVLVFLAAVSIGSVFVSRLGKMAIGAIVLLLALAIAFLASAALSSLGFHPVVSGFEVVTIVLTVVLVGASSTLLYICADYRAWQLLGSLGIFVVPLLLHFYPQEARVQGAGLVLGLLTSIPWLVGLAVGVAIRR